LLPQCFGEATTQDGADGIEQDGSKPGGDQGVAVVDAATTAYLDLAGVLDPAKEAAKLQKQEKEVRLLLAPAAASCASQDYADVRQ
jgi:hypothetical protein